MPEVLGMQNSLKAYFEIARPSHYVKNAFIWLPLFFGYKLNDPAALEQTFWCFLVFCLAASSIYVLNDYRDIQQDREHPVKRNRPLASGVLKKSNALIFLLLLLLLSFAISLIFLSNIFLLILIIYVLINVAYSTFLKHVALIDVVCIAVGYVLRIIAGGLVADVHLTHWIIIMTFLLALFLAFAKRRDDLLLMANGFNIRKSLDGYSLEFISLSMVVMASVIIVSYVLYTISPEVTALHRSTHLYYTSFWVILGLLRYMQITFVEQKSGSPTKIFLKDPFLKTVISLWLLHFFIVMYGSRL